MRKRARRLLSIVPLALLFATPALHADTDGVPYVGYWKFENNVQDSSEAGNNGAAVRVRYVEGRSGRAVDLAGSGRIRVPYDPTMDPENGLSISLWFQLKQYGQEAILVARGDTSRQSGAWDLRLEDGWLLFRLVGEDGGLQTLRVAEPLIPLGTWVNLNAWVCRTAGEIGLVLNSTHVISSTVVDGLEVDRLRQSTADLVMGEGLHGMLDEVEVLAPWE